MKIRHLWLAPLLLFLFFGIGLGLLVSTEPGARWLLSRAIRFAPGLRIANVDGTLLGPLSLKGVDYKTKTGQLTAKEIRLTWRPIHLVRGEIAIDLLSIQGVHYSRFSGERAPGESETGPLPSIDLPLRIVVSKAAIDGIAYTSGDQTVTIDHVAITGRMDEQGLQVESLQVAAPLFDLSLTGKIDPRGAYPFEVSIAWSARPLADAPFQGKGGAKGTLKEFNLHHQLTEPFLIGTQGTVRLDEAAPTFDLNGAWNNVRWPPTEDAMVESTEGAYRLSGRIDDYRFHLQADLHGPSFPGTHWKVEGAGMKTMATLKEVAIQTLDGKINGRGEIAWQPDLRWMLTLHGAGLNPGNHWPDWKGSVGFQLDTNGQWTDRGPIGRFRLSELKGNLRGYPVYARAHLQADQETYSLEALDLRSGPARLIASGELKDRWDLRWKIQAPDLAAILPDAGGSLTGRGTVGGPRSLPTLSADMQGKSLKWAETKVHQFHLNGLIDLQDKIASHLEFTAEGIEAAGQAVARLHAEGKGRIAGHSLQADVRSADQRVAFQIQGGVHGKRWEGTIRQSLLEDKRLGKWILDRPVPMTLAADAVDLQRGCWLQAPARFCMSGRWQQPQGWQAKGRAERLPLALAKSFLPPEVILSGSLDGEWTVLQRDGRLQFKTRWIPRPGMLVYQISGDEPIRIPYQDGLFQAELEGETLRAQTELTFPGQGALQAAATLAPIGRQADWRQSRLKGALQVHLDRLEPISAFVPAVTQARGKLRIDFTVAGTPAEPQVTGQAVLDEGKARIPALGIDLDPLRLEIRSAENKVLRIDGAARSGPGQVKLNGSITLDPEQGWPTRLSVRGDRFESVDLPEAHLFASPDLTFQLRGRRIELNGEVLLPEGKVAPRELPKGAVQVSEDAMVVRVPAGGKIQPHGQGWEIYSRVTIRLGDKVSFNGFGLSGKIAGQLTATDAPDQPTLAEGALRIIEGQYSAYGQKLAITEGRLIFAGPTDNPGLDIRAVRKVEEITAGIHVSGTLKRPQSTLFSEPPMDEANTLSYLLLGRPLNKASSAEGDLMTKAISALGVKGGNLLAKRIGRKLGLDELTLQGGESVEETTLVIGRYLSPKFYVSYGIGLFEASNVLSLRYTISPRLTLRAQSGEENSLDLLYTREYN